MLFLFVRGIKPLTVLSCILVDKFIADGIHAGKCSTLGSKITADVIGGGDVY